jgi:hypothetical protein
MSDGLDDTLLTDLRRVGLSPDEALVYLYLLKVKSATVAEIHSAPNFRKKKRPNLYKILNRMKEKTLLHSEVKEGKTLFFPVRPHAILSHLLLQKQREFEELQAKKALMEARLECVHSTEAVSLEEIDPSIVEFIQASIPQHWIVNERPSVLKLEGTVKQVSVEFNTRRRFGGDAAGVVFFVFRYPNHMDVLQDRLIASLRDGMIDALESSRGSGSFDIKDYSFDQKELVLEPEGIRLPYTSSTVHLNFMNLTGSGGFLTIRLDGLEYWVLGVWAASVDDLTLLLHSIFREHSIRQ